MQKTLQVLELENLLNITLHVASDVSEIQEYESSGTVLLSDDALIIGLNLAGANEFNLSVLSLLEDLQYLNLTNSQVENLESISRLLRLTHLWVAGNLISDLRALGNLAGLHTLDVSHNLVANITVLRQNLNLVSLRLGMNDITDYEPLSNLSKLEELYLDYANVKDLDFIRKLKKLRKLQLGDNRITDLEPISKLVNLTHLELRGNLITNIYPLAGLKKLKHLDLASNRIEEADSLSDLYNLEYLDFQSNKLYSLVFVRELKKLKFLDLYDNQLTEVGMLTELKNLERLSMFGNQIWELPYFGALRELKHLSLGMNEITDISILKDNIGLEELDLDRNPINDFKYIGNLNNLTDLSVSECLVTNIDFLSRLEKISSLDLSKNQIRDFSLISKFSELKILDLRECELTDISFLNELTNLERLFLTDNKIDNLEAVQDLRNLKELHLRSNKIRSDQHLFRLKKLEILNLGNNDLDKISLLNHLPKLHNLDVSENLIHEVVLNKTHNRLRHLNLSYNDLDNVSFIKRTKKLAVITLSNNKINDLKAFDDLSDLYQVAINDNRIEDIEEFSFVLKFKNLKLRADNNPCFNNLHLILDNKEGHLNAVANELYKLKDQQIEATLPEKVVLLGNHASGKSSLLYYLQNGKMGYRDDSTHILKIENYPIKFDKLPDAVIYDFGGQDFYHGIYKAFLTLDALTVLVWRASTNHNHLHLDSCQRPNRNFDVCYWMGQKKYSYMDGQVLMVQTHFDTECGFRKQSYINEYPEVEAEFFVALTNKQGDYNTKLNKIALTHLREKFIDLVSSRKSSRNSNGFMSKPYFNLLLYILNAPASYRPIKLQDLRQHYQVEDNWRFHEEINQLHMQGLILQHGENIWLKPAELTRYVHDEILKKEHVGQGVVEKSLFESQNFPQEIVDLLVDQKVIFLHNFGLSRDFNIQQEYIIPNYLPLHDERHSSFHLMSFGHEKPLFILKFKNFLPFGLINQLVCYFGRLPDSKMFWRDFLIFTIDKKVKVMIKLDFDHLEIKVHAHFGDNIDDNFKNNVEKYLFYCIMAMYWDFSVLPQNLEEFVDSYKKLRGYKKEDEQIALDLPQEEAGSWQYLVDFYTVEACRPTDLYISKDNRSFVHYAALCGIEPGQTKLYSYSINAKRKLAGNREIPAHSFQNFTHKNLKEMKKIFISYSRKDKRFKDELKTHLKLIERYGVAKAWSCEQMNAGEWDEQIQDSLKESDIIIYMVSDNFLASEYIMDKEVNVGLELIKNNPDKRIICVLVRDCSWDSWQFLAENFNQEGKSQANLGRYQFIPWHIFNPKTDDEREELISLEQWGRDGFEVRSLAYKQITNKVLETIKQMVS